MPRSHPIFRPFTQRLIVGGQTFEWTTLGADFCFRPHAAPLSLAWILPGRSDFTAQLALETAGSRVQPLIPASLKIATAFRGQTFWRFWPLDANETLLIRPRFALLRDSDGRIAQFNFSPRLECSHADEQTLTKWLATLESSDSDLLKARAWLQLTTTQKLAQLVEVRGGTWSELMALIEAAFILWAQPDDKFELDLTKPGPV